MIGEINMTGRNLANRHEVSDKSRETYFGGKVIRNVTYAFYVNDTMTHGEIEHTKDMLEYSAYMQALYVKPEGHMPLDVLRHDFESDLECIFQLRREWTLSRNAEGPDYYTARFAFGWVCKGAKKL